jgi:hypothetical protein
MQPSGSGAQPKSVAGHNDDLAFMIQAQLAMINIEPGFVKELSLREGRVHVVVEGPVVSATSAAGLSFDYTHGGTLPIGLCNCFFVGAGPIATLTFDVDLLVQ